MEMENMTSSVKQCPYCGEEIHADAQKCKHCNEWLVKNPPPESKLSASASSEKMGSVQTFFGCLLMFLSIFGLPILLIVIAAFSVPDEAQHRQSIQEDVIECVEDEADQWLGFLGGTLLSPFVSMVINSEFAQQNIKECFYQENTIQVTESKFWSTGKIYNRLHPEGITVSFGIFGIVFPFVEWDDIILMTEENKAKLSRIFSQKNTSDYQSSDSQTPIQQQSDDPSSETQRFEENEMPEEESLDDIPETTLMLIDGTKSYHGDIKGIGCQFNLYFEEADEEEQAVWGTYYYDKYGADQTITLRGVYHLKTGILSLTEYFDDGQPNATMKVKPSDNGFSGVFIKADGEELPITMREQ